MIEHKPWEGSDYSTSPIKGQQVAIVGYSHWLEDGWPDNDDATIDCIRKVMSGSGEVKTASFFTPVRNYFGYPDHKTFWPKVMFFNYLPSCVGGADKRFKSGTPEQRKRAEARFLRLTKDKRPQKVLVFTARSGYFPPAEGLQSIPGFDKFKLGIYRFDDFVFSAYFLRHPQGADKELMRSAVEYILDLPSCGSSGG